MMQPISSNPYLAQQQAGYMIPMPQQQPASLNAVKIDVNNPQVNAPSSQQPTYQSQYAPVTNPYYNYPQAQLYDYPQASQCAQPYCVPQVPQVPQAVDPKQAIPASVDNAINNSNVAENAAVATLNAVAPQPKQQDINDSTTKAPEPVVTQAPPSEQKSEVKAPEVVPPVPVTPQVDLNSFISRLADQDYEVQATAMEEIANMVKDNPQKATELLDEKVITALTNIMNADSSKLAGPTAEQVAARQKMMSAQKLTEAEEKLANTITPMEQAERNKSYAMFTTSIMQKLYGEEVEKLANTTVPLTELPGAANIVEQLKDNPNPMVRTSAIEALSYIGQPAYKADLKSIFEVAQNDKDKNVQETAKIALEKLNAMPEAPKADTAEAKPVAQK